MTLPAAVCTLNLFFSFSYSPDLAPPDFHVFGSLKDALQGRHFVDDNKLKHSKHEELQHLSKVLHDQHTASHTKAEYVSK
jgi:hypothetical protein